MLVKKNIEYLGVKEPNTYKQVKVEIAGLKHAIKIAEELIYRLEQALTIVELKQEEIQNVKTSSEKDTETEKKKTDESND